MQMYAARDTMQIVTFYFENRAAGVAVECSGQTGSGGGADLNRISGGMRYANKMTRR